MGQENHRVNLRYNFVQVSNSVARDSRLSLEARGLLIFALSLPLDWKFNQAWLCANAQPGGLKRHKYLRITKELQDAGYLVRRKEHINGRWSWVYEWSNEPAIQESENRTIVQGSDFQTIENRTIYKEIKETNTEFKKQILKHGSSSDAIASAARADQKGIVLESPGHNQPSAQERELLAKREAQKETPPSPSLRRGARKPAIAPGKPSATKAVPLRLKTQRAPLAAHQFTPVPPYASDPDYELLIATLSDCVDVQYRTSAADAIRVTAHCLMRGFGSAAGAIEAKRDTLEITAMFPTTLEELRTTLGLDAYFRSQRK